ncbi:conserved Plasmodium protein, unknown function [Plasmodium chabaudi chabaudi]|uniref:Uncharacterized protein n=1 Tax=Plasmodium chabaudi chabaudi TaxID=31271 RepID=A0A4V0K7L8_PLACU|nr:conserved Plasmodium protein, unknown function [Plasmodium chabaudi chabaudi]VTZ69016.1 conserved Plasmodium protein, unknown function [Plasmodium chabaudi chabaudi]|eukprot:XP_016653906.1 conserved Plasmodium protein, unknown function [Plasmodium chabaudi chabaudi]
MNHRIRTFLYICKSKDNVNYKKRVIKKFIIKQKTSNKNVAIQYGLYDCKTKDVLVKKEWNINHVLNRKKKRNVKKEKTNENANDEHLVDNNHVGNDIIVDYKNYSNKSINYEENKFNSSRSYIMFLKRVLKNIEDGKNTTVINSGIDTKKNEKNVFFYGSIFNKYLRKENKKDGERTKTSDNCERECIQKGGKRKKQNNKRNMKNMENDKKGICNKQGIIIDIYDYIEGMKKKDLKVSISSWVYRNYKIVDMIKSSGSKYRIRQNICHRCFIKKCIDYPNNKKIKGCINFPKKKMIYNKEELSKCVKYITKRIVKMLKNSELINICFVFKYNIKMGSQNGYIYLINFPQCNIKKNKIFYNDNNEKTLLFLFNKTIVKSIKSVNDYSSIIFPFSISKECQKPIYLKKKMISYIKNVKFKNGKMGHEKYNKKLNKRKNIFNSFNKSCKSDKCSINSKYKESYEKEVEGKVNKKHNQNRELRKNVKEDILKTYSKKEIIFHMHLFELLIRLVFEKTRTYFVFFINKKTYNLDFYKNIYYLNMCKIVNIKTCTKDKVKKVEKRKECEKNKILENLRDENNNYKKIINEKDILITNLENEINEKKQLVSNLKNEFAKYKTESLEKIKTEILKSKGSKCGISKNDSTTTASNTNQQLLKNNNYIKKLYNENNLLKERIKKLMRSNCEDINTNQDKKISDVTKLSKLCLPDNEEKKKETEKCDKLIFYLKAFLDTEQRLYTADVLINIQANIIDEIKKEQRIFFENIERKKLTLKKEIESSFDFIYSVCEDIQTKKEKICLTNRINKLQDCINVRRNKTHLFLLFLSFSVPTAVCGHVNKCIFFELYKYGNN